MALLLVVHNGRGFGWGSPHELGVTVEALLTSGEVEDRRACRKDDEVLRQNLGREGADWGQVIQDIDTAPMRRHQQIRLAWMNRQVAHRNIRQVSSELRPMRPAIDGEEESELGSKEEKILVYQIFADHVSVAIQLGSR